MRLRHARRTPRWRLGLGLLLAVALVGGCVRRTMTIRTEPEGALVRLNDEDVGTSPVTVDFTWYGDYDVILSKEGYETLTTHRNIPTPWYQVPPIDLVAEALVPVTIHDHHELDFELEPASTPNRDELVTRARDFRDRTLFGTD